MLVYTVCNGYLVRNTDRNGFCAIGSFACLYTLVSPSFTYEGFVFVCCPQDGANMMSLPCSFHP